MGRNNETPEDGREIKTRGIKTAINVDIKGFLCLEILETHQGTLKMLIS